MIHKLQFEVTFSDGNKQSGDFTFSKGTTVISGPNERGKSLVLEMIRVGLFGTKALRAALSSYSKLQLSLTFEVSGKVHTVKRTLTDAKLDFTATGTTAVNAAIKNLLGFDYDVFVIANACLQGQVAALSDMKPADRKRMVDTLVKLDRLKYPEQKVTTELAALRKAKGMLRLVDEPTHPGVAPDGCERDLTTRVSELTAGAEACRIAQAVLEAAVEAPAVVNQPVGDLEGLTKTVDALRGLQSTEPEPVMAPECTQDVEIIRENCLAYEHSLRMEADNKFIDCPECGHQFSTSEVHEALPKPKFDRGDIKKILAYREYQRKLAEYEVYKRDNHAVGLLENLREQLEAYRSYKNNLASHREYLSQLSVHTETLEKFKHCSGQLPAAQAALSDLKDYNLALARYNGELKTYTNYLSDLKALEESEEDYLNARKGLADLRMHVKTYLVPSLNRVASKLLSNMTRGTRQSIQVDEQFNIQVDGNPIETLSGSTLAIVNIALRISLGTVLTSKVFSVFMGDEIDAAMDNERARDTLECLKNLQTQQVILVSHKPLQAENCLTL